MTHKDILIACQNFHRRTGQLPQSLYIGNSDYAELIANDEMSIRPPQENKDQERYNGLALYVVNLENHLNVGL